MSKVSELPVSIHIAVIANEAISKMASKISNSDRGFVLFKFEKVVYEGRTRSLMVIAIPLHACVYVDGCTLLHLASSMRYKPNANNPRAVILKNREPNGEVADSFSASASPERSPSTRYL